MEYIKRGGGIGGFIGPLGVSKKQIENAYMI